MKNCDTLSAMPNHTTHLYTINAATPETRAYIEYMIPTWRSNARRYAMNKRQTDAFIEREISRVIAERDKPFTPDSAA